MAALAAEAAQARAKLILVGDPKQLPAVEAGGLLAALAQRVEVVSLVENRRQRDPEERCITAALREGRTELAVRRLDEHGHVTLAHNSDELRDQMVLDWWSHRTAGVDVVMGAVHRSDARDLNARAHAILEAAGALGSPWPSSTRPASVSATGCSGSRTATTSASSTATSASGHRRRDDNRSAGSPRCRPRGRTAARLRHRTSQPRLRPHRPQDPGPDL